MVRIPTIIHQTWKTNRIPARFAAFTQSWKRCHPGWQHVLWTDRSSREYVRRHYPTHLPLYDAYDANIKRVDMFRYLIMHGAGGIYADIDVECLASARPLLDGGHACILGQEPERHAQRLYGRPWLISNAVIASAPGHPFWSHVLATMHEAQKEPDVVAATGPLLLQRAIENYPGTDIHFLPSNVWSPLPDIGSTRLCFTLEETAKYRQMRLDGNYPPEALAVHHWAGTWYSGGLLGALDRIRVKLASRLRKRLLP